VLAHRVALGTAAALLQLGFVVLILAGPDAAPLLLCDLEQKLQLLDATGVDAVVVVPFDEDRSREEAEHFVTDVLAGRLGARLVVVGDDFRFGRGRRGDPAMLEELGPALGFDVLRVEASADESLGGTVSSTAIRRLVASGDVDRAAPALGRHYEVRGRVRRGDGWYDVPSEA